MKLNFRSVLASRITFLFLYKKKMSFFFLPVDVTYQLIDCPDDEHAISLSEMVMIIKPNIYLWPMGAPEIFCGSLFFLSDGKFPCC